MGPRNRFRGIDFASLCSLPGRYDKYSCRTGPSGWESILGLLKRSTNTSSGIVKQSMRAGNRAGIGLSYRPARVENLSPAMGRGIDSRNRVWNWGAKLHRLEGRYDNPMPTWFLAPIAGLTDTGYMAGGIELKILFLLLFSRRKIRLIESYAKCRHIKKIDL
jgi:hypothetical protein